MRVRNSLLARIRQLARAFALVLLVARPAGSAVAPSFFPADPARGRELATVCLVCHGSPDVTLGVPPVHPPKLVGQRPDAIFRILLEYQRGTRTHPIMGPIASTLSIQGMRDLGAYLAATGAGRPPEVAMKSTWAHEEVHRNCTACHGESGMGELYGIPVIAGQNRDYLVSALNAYRDGSRHDSTMSVIAAQLSPDEIQRLAEYFSAQSHLRVTR